jgi:radical SAM superfamily enzyme YgiQ (UPF0313 family)
MRKPGPETFEAFLALFRDAARKAGKEIHVVPYLMSAFPGCGAEDMEALSRWLAARRWRPEQVQCFVPTPGTVAAAMYCAGVDEQGHPLDVPRTDAERLAQHARLAPADSSRKPHDAGAKAGERGKRRSGSPRNRGR